MAVRLTWLVPIEVIIDIPGDEPTDQQHDDAWDRAKEALALLEGASLHIRSDVRISIPTTDLPDPTEEHRP